MNEQIRMLTLKCPSCGAALDVSPDMERFSCGYCGTDQIVQRRGGTVSLKLISDAISRVQTGTDRTAAELALVRLQQELAAINARLVPPSVPAKSINGTPMAYSIQPPVSVPPEWKDPNEAAKRAPIKGAGYDIYFPLYVLSSIFAFIAGLWFYANENDNENDKIIAAIIIVWVALGIPLIIQSPRDWTATEQRRQSYIASLTSDKNRVLTQIAINRSIVEYSNDNVRNAD